MREDNEKGNLLTRNSKESMGYLSVLIINLGIKSWKIWKFHKNLNVILFKFYQNFIKILLKFDHKLIKILFEFYEIKMLHIKICISIVSLCGHVKCYSVISRVV